MVNLVATLGVVAPSGFWQNIIFALNNWVANYALAIILLTLCIKLLMLPVDFFQRRGQAKMQEFQDKNALKMQEIQRKYRDKTMQNQKLGELYKKEGFNPLGSCLTMFVSLGLSILVFFTLLGSLNGISAYKIQNQYQQLQQAYVQEYIMEEQGLNKDSEQDLQAFEELYKELTQEEIDTYILQISGLDVQVVGNAEKIQTAQNAVKTKYAEVKESFLWIKNVWIADTPFARAIPNFDSYAGVAGLKFENDEDGAKRAQAKKVYDAVMSDLEQAEGVNGFFILGILAAGSTFLSQYFVSKKKKKAEQNFYEKQNSQTQQQQNQALSGKAMMVIFPVIMLIFTLTSNSIFALYIVVSQLVAAATAPLITKLIQVTSKKEKAKKAK